MIQIPRRRFLSYGTAALAGALPLSPLTRLQAAPEARGEKWNVLFIAVDDLRPQLGCYGAPMVQSPHIDGLASRGTVFARAYCQQALCSPSRTSLMTGRRPDTTRVYGLVKHFRDTIPDVITLSQQFKRQGYHCESKGKIYHGHHKLNDVDSWSVPAWFPSKPAYHTPEGRRLMQHAPHQHDGTLPWEAPDVPDNALSDGATADCAIASLRRLKGQPFFLATGFFKPHLPFVAPRKYWDIYDPAEIQLADNPFAPKDAPQAALTSWGELRKYHGIPRTGPVTDDQARNLIHGYNACVSYTDAQIGRVITELEQSGLREKTVIILWGDHGWQLGEHGLWCKHTNFETSAHSPLIISVPGQQAGVTSALVEFVDIFPSLCEVCGISLPEGLEGTSFAPLIEDPDKPWKTAAFSQYPRNIPGQGNGMGHSMRTDRYRFTEWTVPGKNYRDIELYDHRVDPRENTNIAHRPENAALVGQLTEQLHAGWCAVAPK